MKKSAEFLRRVDDYQFRREITRAQACRQIGISEARLSQIRNGKSDPSLKLWHKLEEAESTAEVADNLGLKLDPESGEMIPGKGPPPSAAKLQELAKQLKSSKDFGPGIAAAQRSGTPQSSRDATIAKELRIIAASLERLADHINPEKT